MRWSDTCADVVLVRFYDHLGLQVIISPVVKTHPSDGLARVRIVFLKRMRQTHTQLLHHKSCRHPGLQQTTVVGGEYHIYFFAIGIPAVPHWGALCPNRSIALFHLRVGDIATATYYPSRCHRFAIFPAPTDGVDFFWRLHTRSFQLAAFHGLCETSLPLVSVFG